MECHPARSASSAQTEVRTDTVRCAIVDAQALHLPYEDGAADDEVRYVVLFDLSQLCRIGFHTSGEESKPCCSGQNSLGGVFHERSPSVTQRAKK